MDVSRRLTSLMRLQRFLEEGAINGLLLDDTGGKNWCVRECVSPPLVQCVDNSFSLSGVLPSDLSDDFVGLVA